MTLYNWLTLLGVPALIAGLYRLISGAVRARRAERLGVQALLRDSLYRVYRECAVRGTAQLWERENFENMYARYHALGANGVMDGIRQKFMNLPVKEEK